MVTKTSIGVQIIRRKYKGLVHICRREENNMSKQILEWNPHGYKTKDDMARTLTKERWKMKKIWSEANAFGHQPTRKQEKRLEKIM